jgi:hypothetical protein
MMKLLISLMGVDASTAAAEDIIVTGNSDVFFAHDSRSRSSTGSSSSTSSSSRKTGLGGFLWTGGASNTITSQVHDGGRLSASFLRRRWHTTATGFTVCWLAWRESLIPFTRCLLGD